VSAEKPPPIVLYERRRDAKGRVETTFAVSVSQRLIICAMVGTTAALTDGAAVFRSLLALFR